MSSPTCRSFSSIIIIIMHHSLTRWQMALAAQAAMSVQHMISRHTPLVPAVRVTSENILRRLVMKKKAMAATMLSTVSTSSGMFWWNWHLKGALLQIVKTLKVSGRLISSQTMVVVWVLRLLQPAESMEGSGLLTNSLLVQRQQQAPKKPMVGKMTLDQQTTWFWRLMELVLGRILVGASAVPERVRKRASKRVWAKLKQRIQLEVKKVTSEARMMEVMILRKLTVPKQRMTSMMDWQVFLLSRTMQSTSARRAMVKLAPQLASLSEIPTPTSASRIAIRSFAPSPHIPTFHFSPPNTRSNDPIIENATSYCCLNFFTMSALLSGEILANSLAVLVRGGSGLRERKSLSRAKAYWSVVSYSWVVILIFCWTISPSFLQRRVPSQAPLLCSVCFLPSSSTTFSSALRMPARKPVSTAMKMLSPVIIFGSMSESISLAMVSRVSPLSLFSKATRPSAMMSFSNISRSASMYLAISVSSRSLQPQAMVRYPPRLRLATNVSNYLYLILEFLSMRSGAPFTNTQHFFWTTSLTRTDMFWNLDSNWLILRTSTFSPCPSTTNRTLGSLLGAMLNSEYRNILTSTSSPRRPVSDWRAVWQEAKSLWMRLFSGVRSVSVMLACAASAVNLMTSQTSISFWVRVPVLSKQKVLMLAASVAFSGSVPKMPRHLRRMREKELATLKQMGKLGGKLQTSTSRNRNTMQSALIPFTYIMFTWQAQITTPTTSVSVRKYTPDRKKSATRGTRVRILRMMRPRRVAQPVFTTTTRLSSRVSSTLEPSTIHTVSFLVSARLLVGNLPTGMLSPVRLASFTNIYPAMRMPSQLISSFLAGMTTSPGTRSWFLTVVVFPLRMTVTSVQRSAMSLILVQLRQRRMQLMVVVTKLKPRQRAMQTKQRWKMQMIQTAYWKRKKGLVRMSNMYSRQCGISTVCSFRPNCPARSPIASLPSPRARQLLLANSSKLSSNRNPTGIRLPLVKLYLRLLKQTKMWLFQRMTSSISAWPSRLQMKKQVASSCGQSLQKHLTLKLLKYLSRRSPTKERTSGMMRMAVLRQSNWRGLKEWTLHSPSSYFRRAKLAFYQ